MLLDTHILIHFLADRRFFDPEHLVPQKVIFPSPAHSEIMQTSYFILPGVYMWRLSKDRFFMVPYQEMYKTYRE
jgi:hypothetical protein